MALKLPYFPDQTCATGTIGTIVWQVHCNGYRHGGGQSTATCDTYQMFIAGSLELAYSLIWGSHKIWRKGGGDTLDLL